MMDLPFRLIPRAPAGRTDKTLMRPSTRLLLGHIRPATPTNRPGPSRQITFKTSRQSEAESDPNRSHPQYHQPEAQPVLTSEVGNLSTRGAIGAGHKAGTGGENRGARDRGLR